MSATVIHLAHSPDSDDAFMFYALAEGKVDAEGIRIRPRASGHRDPEPAGAIRGELEVTAVSIHAYAYIADRYALLPHGASMGDRYGPKLVARSPMSRSDVRGRESLFPVRSPAPISHCDCMSRTSSRCSRPSTRSMTQCSGAKSMPDC